MAIVCTDTIKYKRKSRMKGIRAGYFMNDDLKANLDYELKRIDKKWDSVTLYDGEEGAAKTTTACANAYYMAHERNREFGLQHIVFTPKQFEKAIEEAKPYDNIVWDEFVTTGLSVEALTSKIQIEVIKRLTMIRSKRLSIHLVIPYIFMLTKYFSIARTRCLIHIYSHDNLERGRFMYYSKPLKRLLYMKGHRFWEYNVQKPDFIGTFTDTFGLFFDETQYERKKTQAMMTLGSEAKMEKLGVRMCIGIINMVKMGMNFTQITNFFEYGGSVQVQDLLKQYEMYDLAKRIMNNGQKVNMYGDSPPPPAEKVSSAFSWGNVIKRLGEEGRVSDYYTNQIAKGLKKEFKAYGPSRKGDM